jgi:hypothetical protein
MEISFLQKMKEHPKPRKSMNRDRGLSLDKIETLEIEINNGNLFPKAYREYLFLGGDYNSLGLSIAFEESKSWEDIPAIKRVATVEMQKQKLSIERPYSILHYYDDDGFIFIYLDEGDNPQPYIFEPFPLKNKEHIFPVKNIDSFSAFIDDLVDGALKGLQPF